MNTEQLKQCASKKITEELELPPIREGGLFDSGDIMYIVCRTTEGSMDHKFYIPIGGAFPELCP